MLCALAALLFTSCGKNDDYLAFVGTWGVERIEYESYNVDYAGNPIASTMFSSSMDLDPLDLDNGIQLFFTDDKKGEMYDSNIDTLWTDWNEVTQSYESFIYCPDTTLVTSFNYSYDKDASILYMSVTNVSKEEVYMLIITDLTSDSFTYENKYDQDNDRVFIERASLKRISQNSYESSHRRTSPTRPLVRGSFLGRR